MSFSKRQKPSTARLQSESDHVAPQLVAMRTESTRGLPLFVCCRSRQSRPIIASYVGLGKFAEAMFMPTDTTSASLWLM